MNSLKKADWPTSRQRIKASAAMGIYLFARRHLEHKDYISGRRDISCMRVRRKCSPTATFVIGESTSALYLASVFTKSDEQEILALAGLLPTTEFWKPALPHSKIETSIFNRIIAKLMGPRRLTRTALPTETRTPPSRRCRGEQRTRNNSENRRTHKCPPRTIAKRTTSN